MAAGSGVQASAHRAGRTALLRYALTFTRRGLGGLGNPGLAEGKSLCTNKPCKAPILLQGSCTDQCSYGGHCHGGKRGWGEGSGEGVCGKRAALSQHLPLLLSVMGKSLLETSGAAVYLLGTCACQQLRQQGAGSSLLCCPLPGNRNSAETRHDGVSPRTGG